MKKEMNGFDVNYSTWVSWRRVHVWPLFIHPTTITFFLSHEKLKNVGDINFCGKLEF